MTKEMIDFLLAKRYRVIAPSPGCLYSVGSIILKDSLKVTKASGNLVTRSNIGNYPHLFKELKWSEERTEDQMPEYVMYQPKGEAAKYIRVYKHFTNRDGAQNIYGFMFENEFYSYKHCTPITEEEYLRSIKN